VHALGIYDVTPLFKSEVFHGYLSCKAAAIIFFQFFDIIDNNLGAIFMLTWSLFGRRREAMPGFFVYVCFTTVTKLR